MAHFDIAARALRWMFFAMGLPVGMLVPRLAEIKAGLEAGNGAYGSAIAIGGAGAMLGSWLGGRVVHSFGSRSVATVAVFAILAANIGNALVPSIGWLAVMAFLSGFSFSLNNIAVNSQAVLVEQGLGHSFVPRAHAFWSLGTMSAALVSSLIAPYVTPLHALCGGAVVSIAIYQYWVRGLLTTEHEDRPHDDPTQLPRNERVPRGAMGFLILLAFAQALGLVAEMSVGDWSSVLLKQEFHIAVGPNGYGFTAFMVVQLATRLYASRLIDRIGLKETVRLLGYIGTAGYLVALAGAASMAESSKATTLVLACIAYASLGIAVGAMPSAFTSAAGGIPGLPSARALTITGLLIGAFGLAGRLTLATITQVIPLTVALAATGAFVLLTISLSFVLVPERAERHAIRR